MKEQFRASPKVSFEEGEWYHESLSYQCYFEVLSSVKIGENLLLS